MDCQGCRYLLPNNSNPFCGLGIDNRVEQSEPCFSKDTSPVELHKPTLCSKLDYLYPKVVGIEQLPKKLIKKLSKISYEAVYYKRTHTRLEDSSRKVELTIVLRSLSAYPCGIYAIEKAIVAAFNTDNFTISGYGNKRLIEVSYTESIRDSFVSKQSKKAYGKVRLAKVDKHTLETLEMPLVDPQKDFENIRVHIDILGNIDFSRGPSWTDNLLVPEIPVYDHDSEYYGRQDTLFNRMLNRRYTDPRVPRAEQGTPPYPPVDHTSEDIYRDVVRELHNLVPPITRNGLIEVTPPVPFEGRVDWTADNPLIEDYRFNRLGTPVIRNRDISSLYDRYQVGTIEEIASRNRRLQ